MFDLTKKPLNEVYKKLSYFLQYATSSHCSDLLFALHYIDVGKSNNYVNEHTSLRSREWLQNLEFIYTDETGHYQVTDLVLVVLRHYVDFDTSRANHIMRMKHEYTESCIAKS